MCLNRSVASHRPNSYCVSAPRCFLPKSESNVLIRLASRGRKMRPKPLNCPSASSHVACLDAVETTISDMTGHCKAGFMPCPVKNTRDVSVLSLGWLNDWSTAIHRPRIVVYDFLGSWWLQRTNSTIAAYAGSQTRGFVNKLF